MSRDRSDMLGTVFLSRDNTAFLLLADDTVKHRVTLFVGGISIHVERAELARLIARGDLEERAARIVPEASELVGRAS